MVADQRCQDRISAHSKFKFESHLNSNQTDLILIQYLIKEVPNIKKWAWKTIRSFSFLSTKERFSRWPMGGGIRISFQSVLKFLLNSNKKPTNPNPNGLQRKVFIGEISYTNKFCVMSYGMKNVGNARELKSLNFEFNLEFKIQVIEVPCTTYLLHAITHRTKLACA